MQKKGDRGRLEQDGQSNREMCHKDMGDTMYGLGKSMVDLPASDGRHQQGGAD